MLVTLPAVAITPEARDSFRLPKLLLSEALGLASLWLLSWRLWTAGRIDLRSFWRHPALLAIAPVLAVATLGLVTSDHPHHVRQALISLWIGGACFVGWSLALSESERRRILDALLLPAAILALIAIAQDLGAMPFLQIRGDIQERIALTSLAGGAFDLATCLVLPILLAQVRLYRDVLRGRRWWSGHWPWRLLRLPPSLYVLVASSWVVVLTQTLAAIAAVLVASFVLWLLLLPRKRVLAVAVAVALLALALVVSIAPLHERLVRKTESLLSGDVNRAVTGRLDGWWAALWMFREHPWVGVGHGAYRAEFGTARLALHDEGVQFFVGQHQTYFSNAHNEVLEVLAEWGLVGLLAVAWAVAYLARRLRLMGREEVDDEDENRWRRALAWSGTVAIAILSLTNFPWRIALVAYPWLFFLSWVFGARPRPSETARRGVDGRGLVGILLAVLTLALFLHGRQALRRWQASQKLARVESAIVLLERQGLLDQHPMPVAGRRMLEGLVEVLRDAAELDPIEVGIPVARGSAYYFLERPQAAIRAYQEALELEQRGETYANLGRAYLLADDRDAAREAFRKALVLNRDIVRRYRSYLMELDLIGRRR